MKHLHPGVKWSFRLGGIFSVLFFSIFFSPFFVAISVIVGWVAGLVYFMFIIFLFILVEVFTRLSYKYWKYEFAENELKIEKGIIWKVYKSIPYSRVQNVDIRRGILARILGFSSLDLQTAGYSSYGGRNGGVGAEGHIPAIEIEEAEKIRDLLIKKIGKRSGL